MLAQLTDNCCAECPDGVVIRVNGAITQTVPCCCMGLVLEIINGQLHITNPNSTGMNVLALSGSIELQGDLIPANSTVIATGYSFDSNGKICVEGYY